MAITMHMIHNFGEGEDSLFFWLSEIFVASLFAMGFGWHLSKFVTLTRMEKRGKHSFIEEF